MKNLIDKVNFKGASTNPELGRRLLASRGVNADGSSMTSAQMSESKKKSRGARLFKGI